MYGLHTLIVFLAAVLILICQIGGKLIFTSFVHLFSDKACLHGVFTITAGTPVQCVFLCVHNATRKSVFYKHSTRACTGCAEFYASANAADLIDDVGTQYYGPYALHGSNCSATQPCIKPRTTCFPGLDTCVCDPLTSNYNEATGTCTPGCANYSNGFQRFPNREMTWNGDWQLNHDRLNLTACLESCTKITIFTCHSVDYNPVSYDCFYLNYDLPSFPHYLHDRQNFDVYIRNCLN